MRYFLLIFLLSPLINYAQTVFQCSLDNQSGYEYNPFNQPHQIPLSDSTNSGIQSGAFQQIALSSSWKKIFKKHQFHWQFKGKVDHFWNLKAANLLRWETNVGYQYQWSKSKFLKTRLKYLSYQTNRLDNGAAVITVPAAYRRWSSQIAYHWSPFKNNKSVWSSQFIKKSYAAIDQQQLRYNALVGKFKTTQKFRRTGKKSSYWGWEMNFQQRDYLNSPTQLFWDTDDFEIADQEIDVTEIAEWEEEIEALTTERRWQYFTSTLDYAFFPKKSLKLTTGVTFQNRKDVWDEQFGYRQFAYFFQTKWKKQSWEVSWKITTTFRQFTDLFADSEEDYVLQHLYLRNSFLLRYELTNTWSIFTQLSMRKRWRNQPEAANNSYLPYFTGLTSIGLKYQWNKKMVL